MFTTIIAGSNGELGREAAALAHTIARDCGARLLLVGVEPELPLGLVESHAQMRDALHAAVREVRDERAPTGHVEAVVGLSPAHALRRIAEAEHADLIVVGSRRRGPLQRVVSGDVAAQVLHGAPCAVAVAPDHVSAAERITCIGVGLDDTPESGQALDMALDLARLTGAQLRLLSVASDVYAGSATLVSAVSYAEAYRVIIDARLQRARTIVAQAAERCGGVEVVDDVRLGTPTSELCAFSSECDLLVLGSRRWGPVRRLALGSTSERVIRQAACPVLVPPRETGSEHADAPLAAASSVAT